MRVKVNLSIDEGVTREARALGLNMSRVAEAAIAEAARLERNRRWREGALRLEQDRGSRAGGL